MTEETQSLAEVDSAPAPEATAAESLDPRDPLLRLSTFFDPGSVKPLHERDKSGVLAASGTVNGAGTTTVLVAGDDADAKGAVTKLVEQLRAEAA